MCVQGNRNLFILVAYICVSKKQSIVYTVYEHLEASSKALCIVVYVCIESGSRILRIAVYMRMQVILYCSVY